MAQFVNDSVGAKFLRALALLNLRRTAEAATVFEAAESLLGARNPSTFLLAGEAAANWAAGANDKAVATYVRLIYIDKSVRFFWAAVQLARTRREPISCYTAPKFGSSSSSPRPLPMTKVSGRRSREKFSAPETIS
jgi:hypothetical protein